MLQTERSLVDNGAGEPSKVLGNLGPAPTEYNLEQQQSGTKKAHLSTDYPASDTS